jgi:hypothetical protein
MYDRKLAQQKNPAESISRATIKITKPMAMLMIYLFLKKKEAFASLVSFIYKYNMNCQYHQGVIQSHFFHKKRSNFLVK